MMSGPVFFVFVVGLILLLTTIAVVFCVMADRLQLSLSYRAAQRRFRRYRASQADDIPSVTQSLLSDPALRSARNLKVIYPSAVRTRGSRLLSGRSFRAPRWRSSLFRATRKLAKLGLMPFARSNSISLYCAPLDTHDLRLWSYDTKSGKAYPMDIEYSKLLADLRATLSV